MKLTYHGDFRIEMFCLMLCLSKEIHRYRHLKKFAFICSGFSKESKRNTVLHYSYNSSYHYYLGVIKIHEESELIKTVRIVSPRTILKINVRAITQTLIDHRMNAR